MLFIETHLLDQLRVVWVGQVFPVWVESKTVCVFLKVGKNKQNQKNIDSQKLAVIILKI